MPKQKDQNVDQSELHAENSGENKTPTIDQLQAEIERLQVELEAECKRTQEEHDCHLRALADFANYRRRREEDYKQACQFAAKDLIVELLPVIDNFERALEAADQNHSYESLAEGVKLILRQLNEIMEKEGVSPIEASGQQFDPMLHEAVMRVETTDYPENTIVEELQKGYSQHGQVIRPSRVRVATHPD